MSTRDRSDIFVPSTSCTVASGDCLIESRCLGVCDGESRKRCVVDDPLCPSHYEGCTCDCDSDMDGTVLNQYRMRAINAERMLLAMVRAVRRNAVNESLLKTATRVAMKHDN